MTLFWEICINIISGFRCESGVWLGKFSPCSPSGNTLEEITAAGYDMPCILDPLPEESRLVMFYQDKEVVDQVEVPAGEDITVRCSDIGKYRLEVIIPHLVTMIILFSGVGPAAEAVCRGPL